MAMNDTAVHDDDTRESQRPLSLARTHAAALIARRIMPDAIPDDGMAPLDVAGFTSAI